MAFGVVVWSLASGASGLASGLVVMLLTRGVVGVGEAAYGPAAPAVLSDPTWSNAAAASSLYFCCRRDRHRQRLGYIPQAAS